MDPLPGYTLEQLVREEAGAATWRGQRLADGRRVIVELLAPPAPAPELARLRQAFELGRSLQSGAVLRPLALEQAGGQAALVLEDLGGRFLDELLEARLELDQALALAVGLAESLVELHARGLVHRDLRPQRLVALEETGRVLLADLGLAAGPGPPRGGPAPPPAAWPYLSPEQTGRTSRPIDARSDLYAAGVVLYHLLAGQLPFRASSALEWAHAHLARTPPALGALRPQLPPVLSALVMRLLAKSPEDRYQGAAGLLADLRRCAAQWAEHQRIEPFALGGADTRGQLRTPHLLYGREPELARLGEALERVASRRRPELLLIRGEPGVGKSALVSRLATQVAEAGGLYLAGKFDAQQQGVPYSAFVQALRGLCRQLAAEEEGRARWGPRLQAALGAAGQLLAELVPELTWVTGPLPEAARLSPGEEQARFLLLVRQLLETLAQEHPLALFLDDLQWADPASLQLLLHLAGSSGAGALLLLGAYRERDVGPADALPRLVEQLRQGGAAVSELGLAPLPPAELARLLGEALAAQPGALAPLAELVHDKARGNPFFALQVLGTLHRAGLLTFDPGAGAWRWDAYRIRTLALSEDVVELVVEKLRRLPPGPRSVLTLAACLGSPVELEALRAASPLPGPELAGALEVAVGEGLLQPVEGGYRFAHDRVQQAAYALVPPPARAAEHLRIGRQLLLHTPPQALPQRLFALVGQLNPGSAGVDSPAERLEIARLNLLAGRRAKAAAAYRAALGYLQAGLTLLGPEPWGQPALARPLLLEQAICALCAGDLEVAERLLAELLAHARTPVERAEAYRVQIELHTTRGALGPAIASAVACLGQYGLELSPDPSAEQVAEEEAAVARLLGERPVEALLGLEPMRGPELEAAMGVLAAVLPTAYFAHPHLHHLVACRMVELTLRHGVVPASSMGLAAYAFELAIAGREYDLAARLGRLALALVERRDFQAYEAKVCNLLGATVVPWSEPLRSALPYLEQGLRAAQRSGDVVFACLEIIQLVALTWAAGEPLEEVERRERAAHAFIRAAQYESLVSSVEIFQRHTGALRGRPPAGPAEAMAEEAFARRSEQSVPFVATWYHLMRLELHLIFGDPAAALAEARRTSGLIVHLRGQTPEAEYACFAALALAGSCAGAPPEAQAGLRAEAEAHQARLRRWAARCPANFLAPAALVGAELARLRGQAEQAMAGYEQARRAAREGGHGLYEALASELAARFHAGRAFPLVADAYLEEACRAYRRWGAEAKARQLELLHPRLASRPGASPPAPAGLSVVRASQALSQEIVLPRLLEALLRSALEEAGAERGVLLTYQAGQLVPRVTAQLSGERTEVTLLAEPGPAAEVPRALLAHLQQLQRPVLLDDAAQPNPFASDPYLASRRVRSVLGLPILQHGALLGALYLENNQLAGAFTPERTLTLEVLAAQAAISLENARLYQAAQEAVQVRDDFLTAASHELKTPVSALKLQLQALQRTARGPDAQLEQRLEGLLRAFDRQVSRLGRLAEEMLDVAQLRSGPPALQREELELTGLVQEQVAALAELLAAAGCPVRLELDGPVVGRWDRARLGRVVAELLLNASKFGVGRPVGVRVRRSGGAARLEVWDQGIGIDRADQGRIFERFAQAASVRHYGGLGLGLYLARETVLAHGGSITVESEPGAGATFVVELPLGVTDSVGAEAAGG